ncbi:centrosomal protein of 70 kDa isoform X8 [Emydura macquarii macquarii]|uniref:centrosomal protein of 70 kDa isoform X8 n=1 Tax=Emydura macquarii macquarii TaxID=1129001 RepID=UPI00352A8723
MTEVPQNRAMSGNAPAGSMLGTPTQKSTESWSWNVIGCQEEQAEWENVNKLLVRHGLKPVCLAKPRNSRNLSDVIILDKHSSLGIRLALKTLVEDTERQQKIMHGLIEANRQLRDEIRQARGWASRQEQRAKELENIVENIKSKICQLEDECIAKVCQQQNQVKELQKDQQASQTKYHQQKEKLHEQEETIARLQKELHKVGMEEQQRVATQNKMFCQFCKRAPKSLLDQQFLSLIDYYESQINQMKKELSRYKKDTDHVQEEGKSKEEFLNLDATPNYRALLTFVMLQSFQNQLIETKARNEQLLCENTDLKKDLETRPTAQELKFYKQQVKKLEKMLKKNIKSYGIIRGEKIKENKESESITGEDQLQTGCRRYLQDLYRSLRKLSVELVPWHTVDTQNSECIRVEDLQFIVDTMLEEVENKEKNSQMPSLQTLYAIVSHFQKLFDVSSLNGVYPRMNEVYTKLGEMTNAMRNLHDLLELDHSTPPAVLVNTVGKLCNIINENVTGQVEQLLGTQDIQSIINKLEEHEDFFPVFQALIQDLLHVLGPAAGYLLVTAIALLKPTGTKQQMDAWKKGA